MANWVAAEFFDWWGRELRAFVAENSAAKIDQAIELSLDRIVLRASSREILLEAESVDDLKNEFRARALTGQRTEILIDPRICLQRPNGSRRLPADMARSSAELDLMASTPIKAEDVHVLTPTDRSPVYFVVKKRIVDPMVAVLRGAETNVVSIAVKDGDTSVPLDPASFRAVWPLSPRERLARRVGHCALAASLALAVATYGFACAQHWRASAELDEKIAALQVEAKAARTKLQARQAALNSIARVRAAKSEAVPVVTVLNEMTKRLPDTVWLSDFEIAGQAVSVSGYAQSASSLVAELDASPLFEAPSFAGPVVRAPGQDGERFSLQLNVSGP